MSTHPRAHEELLAALAAGDRRPSEPEVERALQACAECAREWAEIEDTLGHLARVEAEEREALEELRAVPSAPGEERVLPTLARLAAEGTDARRGPRRLGAWLVAAAVLLAGAWLVLRVLGPERDRAPTWLGDGLHLEAPRGEVPGFARFSWTYTGPDADSYTLRIFEVRDGEPGKQLLERPGLKETTWIPTSEELEQLPARIAWRVEALDAFRFVLPSGSDSAQAWLSR